MSRLFFQRIKTKLLLTSALFAGLSLGLPAASSGSWFTHTGQPTLILADKKKNQIHVAEYSSEKYRIIKTYPVTMGKVLGDKMEEDDLKTPEGIYTFTSRLTPPSIKPKFGVMAFYMNYPNPFDRLAGYTGYDIMLHATDEPDRLKKEYDSLGCLVVKNEQLSEIQSYVRLNLTPILVFNEFSDRFLSPAKDQALNKFFYSWIEAWESRDIDQYVKHYHSAFTSGGRDLAGFKKYKATLNKKYEKIEVNPEKVKFFRHPKYSMVMFTQKYRSTLKGGRKGHISSGTKMIYVAEESGQLKIISEDFTNETW